MKIRARARERFEYFAQCQDHIRMEPIKERSDGKSALECFHSHETYGIMPDCSEPVLLARALNGKERHGMTVQMMAEDYVDRILFASDLKEYPRWIQMDVLGSARKVAMEKIGFVPKFVDSGEDFSTLPLEIPAP